MALVAAGLEPKAIGRLELLGSLGSLKELVESNTSYNAGNGMELFCFGLLEVTDIKQLVALAAPRPVSLVNPSGRAKKELSTLAAWYRLWDRQFDPLRN
jgi:hypothetical protein